MAREPTFGDYYSYEEIEAAVAEFNDLDPVDRSRYYEEFFDDWDFVPEEESLFWELYRES